MSGTEAFTPGATVSLAVTTATGRVALPSTMTANGGSVRVVNSGTVTAFIKFGDVSVTAATTDIPVLAGAIEVFSIGPITASNATVALYAAGITASGTPTIYFTAGQGI